MTFNYLKNSYIGTIQIGLAMGTGYEEMKRGNETLCKICEAMVENSCCTFEAKHMMKSDLKRIKEIMSFELRCLFY